MTVGEGRTGPLAAALRAGRLVLNLCVVYNVISSAPLHVVFDHLGSILKAKKKLYRLYGSRINLLVNKNFKPSFMLVAGKKSLQ